MIRRVMNWLRREREPVVTLKWETPEPAWARFSALRVFRVEAGVWTSPVNVLEAKKIPRPGAPWDPGSKLVCETVRAIELKPGRWEVVCRYGEEPKP